MAQPRPQLSRREPLHQQVATNIRNDINAGVLRDGARLASTRELAEEWGVSVHTINEAMRVLADEGLILNKPKSGRIVVAPEQTTRLPMRTSRPQAILIGGYAGTGKSEFGRILAREAAWTLLDKDTLTRPVVEAALEALGASPNDRESDAYRTKVRPREYEALRDALIDNLACANSVIVTAPFLQEFADHKWLSRTRADCAEFDADLTVVWMHADADIMHLYLRHRGAARDATKLENWTEYLSGIDLDLRPSGAHRVIENHPDGEPLTSQARLLLRDVFAAERTA